MSPEVSEPSRRSVPWWPGLFVALAILSVHAWTLALDFSSDDFLFLTRVPKNFVPEPWIGDDPCSGAPLWYHEMVLAVPDRYMFRPAAWAVWWALARIQGPIASSVLFHASVLAIHAAATFLLYALLRRPAGAFAAACGALAFGLAPGSLQAVTWIAATGDTLSVPFLLLSALFLQRGRARSSAAADVLAGICFTLAVASKESAAYFAPAVAFAALLAPRGERPSPLARLAPAFAVPFLLFVVLRRAYTGNWGPPWSALALPWRGIPDLKFLGQTLAPWEAGAAEPFSVRLIRSLGFGDPRTAARVAGAAITLMPALVAVLVRPHRMLPRLLLAAVAVAIGIIPISRYLLAGAEDLQSNGIGRAAYPISAIVASVLALALGALARWPKTVLIALLVPLVLWQADYLVHVAGVELKASRQTRLRRASLADIAAKHPPDTWFVAVEKAESSDRFRGVFNGYFIEDAFKPPFVEMAVPVTWMPRLPEPGKDGFDLPRCVREHPASVRFLALDEHGAYEMRDRTARPPLPGPEVAIQEPAAWTAFDRTMPAIAWTPLPSAARHRVDLLLRKHGIEHVWTAAIESSEPRIAFVPDLMLTFEDRPVSWRYADAALRDLLAGPKTVQVDFRVTSSDGAGKPVGVSEWRTFYLTPRYQ
jgi:hypothetical protein